MLWLWGTHENSQDAVEMQQEARVLDETMLWLWGTHENSQDAVEMQQEALELGKSEVCREFSDARAEIRKQAQGFAVRWISCALFLRQQKLKLNAFGLLQGTKIRDVERFLERLDRLHFGAL
jgi:uncharacterized protein YoaH (UPF0181 family)